MMRRRALVLGASGFIGRHVVAALLRDEWEVRTFTRRRATADAAYGNAVDVCEGDFSDPDAVALALVDCDTVFHLIGTTLPEASNRDVAYDLASNVVPTLRFLDLAVRLNVRRVVFSSSGGTVYGLPDAVPIPETHKTDPRCAYGVHKLTIEKYLALYQATAGLDCRILRVANAFGEGQAPDVGQGAVATFLSRAITGETIDIWGDGLVVRDYIHVSDVARAFTRAGRYAGPHTIFNVGTGVGLTVLDLVDAIERLLERPVGRRHLPSRGFDVPLNVLDVRLATTCLGWRPEVSFADGLRRTLEWQLIQPPARARIVSA